MPHCDCIQSIKLFLFDMASLVARKFFKMVCFLRGRFVVANNQPHHRTRLLFLGLFLWRAGYHVLQNSKKTPAAAFSSSTTFKRFFAGTFGSDAFNLVGMFSTDLLLVGVPAQNHHRFFRPRYRHSKNSAGYFLRNRDPLSHRSAAGDEKKNILHVFVPVWRLAGDGWTSQSFSREH